MAFVRRHGNQLAIVHGIRDPETGKVGQHALFNFYTRKEATEALSEQGGTLLRALVQNRYAGVRLDWPGIFEALRADLDFLPDKAPGAASHGHGRFHRDMLAFARQVVLTSPADLSSAGEIIEAHRLELGFLMDLVGRRLEAAGRRQESDLPDPFGWRYRLHPSEVPPDVEEFAEGLYEEGEDREAIAAFTLLTEAFDNYAEGHNYLGLIALRAGRLDDAVAAFTKTTEVGRRLFPKRIRKDQWWSDLDTRPYIRGLCNLAIALNRAGRFDDAMDVTLRLERECGMVERAVALRGPIYLNQGRPGLASESGRRLERVFPSEGLVVAFGEYQMGHREKALRALFHAAMSFPFSARLVTGTKCPRPKDWLEARDYNGGVDLLRDLDHYLRSRGRKARTFLRRIMGTPEMASFLDELLDARRKQEAERSTGGRAGFDREHEMKSDAFADHNSAWLADLMRSSEWWWK